MPETKVSDIVDFVGWSLDGYDRDQVGKILTRVYETMMRRLDQQEADQRKNPPKRA